MWWASSLFDFTGTSSFKNNVCLMSFLQLMNCLLWWKMYVTRYFWQKFTAKWRRLTELLFHYNRYRGKPKVPVKTRSVLLFTPGFTFIPYSNHIICVNVENEFMLGIKHQWLLQSVKYIRHYKGWTFCKQHYPNFRSECRLLLQAWSLTMPSFVCEA